MNKILERENQNLYGISYRILFSVIILCLFPSILNILGFNFQINIVPLDLSVFEIADSNTQKNILYAIFKGRFVHVLIVSISISIALITALLSFVDYRISRDISTPIIGIALLSAGVFDTFYLLIVTRIIDLSPNISDITPFSWAFARTFHALTLISGVSVYLFATNKNNLLSHKEKNNLILLISFIFVLLTVFFINLILSVDKIPQMVFPNNWISKPYALIPLFFYVFAGIFLLPKFYQSNPTRFSQMLIISLIPAVFSQIHMAFGSEGLFDNHFFIAHYLEAITYFIPVLGILMNYTENYKSEKAISIKLNEEIEFRKNAQLELKRNELLLIQAQEIGKMGSFEWNIKTNEVVWSEEIYRIHEYKPYEIEVTFQTFMDHLEGDEKVRISQLLQDAIISKSDLDYEFEFITINKNRKYGSAKGKIFYDSDGSPIKYTGVLQDITKAKTAEISLKESQIRFQSVFEQTFQMVSLLDLEGKLLEINHKALEVSGLSNSDKMLGTNFGDFPAWKSGSAKELIKIGINEAKNGKTSNFETVIFDWKTNKIDVAMVIKPIYNSKKELVNILVEGKDISDIKRYEQELELKINDLNRSNKELEQFAYVASHDLQEPLRKIQSFSERLYGKYAPLLEGDGKDYMDRMQNAALRMQILINDLLSFSKLANVAEKLETINLNDIINPILNDFEIEIENKKAIITVKDLPTIMGISAQMRQLFQNLLSNSLKFSREGIVPEIDIWSEPADLKNPKFSTLEKSAYTIFFKDNGIGFDQKYSEKVFVIFQRLHGRSEYEGTGIGLSICKKIIENHKGFIEAISELGKGTTFKITLMAANNPINRQMKDIELSS